MAANTFVGELMQGGLYKPSQGRITRQVTCGTIWLVCLIAAYRLYYTLLPVVQGSQAAGLQMALTYGLPLLVVAIGGWGGYRLVNYPRFADFLIAVEAEMNKVSWPSWPELVRSSAVVIIVMFALAGVLIGFDALWTYTFKYVLPILR